MVKFNFLSMKMVAHKILLYAVVVLKTAAVAGSSLYSGAHG